jgi:hypothetical protein
MGLTFSRAEATPTELLCALNLLSLKALWHACCCFDFRSQAEPRLHEEALGSLDEPRWELVSLTPAFKRAGRSPIGARLQYLARSAGREAAGGAVGAGRVDKDDFAGARRRCIKRTCRQHRQNARRSCQYMHRSQSDAPSACEHLERVAVTGRI